MARKADQNLLLLMGIPVEDCSPDVPSETRGIPSPSRASVTGRSRPAQRPTSTTRRIARRFFAAKPVLERARKNSGKAASTRPSWPGVMPKAARPSEARIRLFHFEVEESATILSCRPFIGDSPAEQRRRSMFDSGRHEPAHGSSRIAPPEPIRPETRKSRNWRGPTTEAHCLKPTTHTKDDEPEPEPRFVPEPEPAPVCRRSCARSRSGPCRACGAVVRASVTGPIAFVPRMRRLAARSI